MSRRRGQSGHIERTGKWVAVRFWIDVEGQAERKHACVRICPASGPGSLSRSEQRRKAREIIAESGADSEQHYNKVVLGHRVTTFREQAKVWVDWLQTRNNDPIPQTSVPSIESAIEKWLNPILGDLPLSEVGNRALNQVVNTMRGKLKPKTQWTYSTYAKQIRQSLVNDEGEPVFPVKWNNRVIDLPRVVSREQVRGKLNAEEIQKVIAASETKWAHAVCVIAAATGMRIAEILGLDIASSISPDCSMILVKQQTKGSRIVEYLKSDAAHRVVDLCPEAAKFLAAFIGERTGLLFPSLRKGKGPMSYRSFLRWQLTPAMERAEVKEPGKGAHAFRRFRASVLRRSGVEEDLRKFWLGHENPDLTARYAEQVREDNAWRQAEAAKVGLGFTIPEFASIVREVPELSVEVAVGTRA
jgi:integrase